jgi:hypothetical protein
MSSSQDLQRINGETDVGVGSANDDGTTIIGDSPDVTDHVVEPGEAVSDLDLVLEGAPPACAITCPVAPCSKSNGSRSVTCSLLWS